MCQISASPFGILSRGDSGTGFPFVSANSRNISAGFSPMTITVSTRPTAVADTALGPTLIMSTPSSSRGRLSSAGFQSAGNT